DATSCGFFTARYTRRVRVGALHCNVEGSFVYHIASDGVRALLGIPATRRGLNAEYVLLFDGLEKHHFKDSLVETLREESLSTPPLEVTSAGHRTRPAQLCGLVRARRTDIPARGRERGHARAARALPAAQDQAPRVVAAGRRTTPREAARFEPFRSLQAASQVVRDIIQKNIHPRDAPAPRQPARDLPAARRVGLRNSCARGRGRDHGRGSSCVRSAAATCSL
ncbi:hypothetical protein PINS_up018800, partial [Pythium insidiosum]